MSTSNDAPTSFDPLDYIDTAKQILEARKRGENLEWEYYLPGTNWERGVHIANPLFYIASICYPIRIKPSAPWTLGREVNGHKLTEGQEWHRNDWRKEDLPGGYRPLMLGEPREIGDEHASSKGWLKVERYPLSANKARREWDWCRTTRPMPSVKWAAEREAYERDEPVEYRLLGPKGEPWGEWKVCHNPKWGDECDYRIAPTPREVPLGPEDVPPGSAIGGNVERGCWTIITEVNSEGVFFDGDFHSFRELMEEKYLIHRPGDNDTNGKPVFRKCSKTITV